MQEKEKEMENETVTPEQLRNEIKIAVRQEYAEAKAEERKAERKRALYATRKLMEEYMSMRRYAAEEWQQDAPEELK